MASNTTPNTPPATPPASDEVTRLRAENAKLREQLAESREGGDDRFGTPKTSEPSFGMSEGQRQELELTGKTVSPFTGARQVGTGEPGSKPRVVDRETFEKAGK